MDKRKAENARVKKNIEDAFFELLKEKNFSGITVTDIVKKAGVARTSYYHNFQSKEDIIREYIRRLHDEIDLAMGYSANTYGELLNCQSIAVHISYYLREKHIFILLYNSGFGTFMLEEANYYMEEALGDMPCYSIERYRLYFISGAFLNVMMQWLNSGARETPMEMAQIILDLIEKYQ